VVQYIIGLVSLSLFVLAGINAYSIRLYAVNTFGRVIHEFDPWFNFRATQYLADNGWNNFFSWFDHRSWYPLGRPVGTTIYPGMQIAAVGIWKALNYAGYGMSLNDVCVFVPAWFGVSATIFTGLLTRECSGSSMSGAFASIIMAIIPAHIMRSVAGGYDNESVAITTMTATFYFWVRSLRSDPAITDGAATRDSYIYGAICGLAYICMAATWGGFIFVLNLIGAHAAALAILGRYTSKLHRAYSLFFIIGTAGATRVPVIGMNPFKSLEQLAPLGVFLGFQVLEYCEIQRRKKNLSVMEHFQLRVKVATPFVLLLALVLGQLSAIGYFGPLTARVRGLFVKHTRTGNPLVDSVAEHQPASAQAYQQYLNIIYTVAPYGFLLSFLKWTDSNSFLPFYGIIAYFFANKMSRLVVLLGPIASALGGVALGFVADELIVKPLSNFLEPSSSAEEETEQEEEKPSTSMSKASTKKGKKKATTAKKAVTDPLAQLVDLKSSVLKVYNTSGVSVIRLVSGMLFVVVMLPQYGEFYKYCHAMAERMSHPSIMFQGQLRNGQTIIVDDYREGYWWLRDNTPYDTRVLSWWDYGYQISGIANRTTLADGNTWNHEHIATLGRILTAPQEDAHRIARHLADYVLVWTGGGGDDLAKSPHMARIGNSVYPGLCPDDPTCAHFGFYSREPMMPTPSMEKSLLYVLSMHGIQKNVKLNEKLFTLAYQTKYGKMRIFKIENVSQKSRKWLADPANRNCDHPGSWYCPGNYPPALKKFIGSRKDFKQLEDFNTEKDEEARKYQEQYMKNMDKRRGAHGPSAEEATKKKAAAEKATHIKVGCFTSEKALGSDKEYGGGTTGASFSVAKMWAKQKGKKYLAIARVGTDGHSFAFDEEPQGKPIKEDKGCRLACLDTSDMTCGCADGACGDLKAAEGEPLRRWMVYEIL